MTAKLIPYLRVSTSRQGESGLGLEAQREAIRQYAKRVGAELLVEHVEVESGKVTSRPRLAAALAECRKEKATLVIARLDRLARSVAFVSKLMESDISFIACDMPGADRFILHVLAALAEKERELISERTKAALAAAKARGTILGKNGRTLAEKNKATAQTFAKSLEPDLLGSIKNGNQTLRQHADYLNSLGRRTAEGGRFYPCTVQRILSRVLIKPDQGGTTAICN